MEKAEEASSSASTSATNAKTSETNASASASSASTSASNAKTSETNAKTSETNAKASETNAKTSETNAKSSESNAKTYASNASTSATNAKTSETNASASAKSASTSATNASASETNAKTSETNASTSATNASTSAKEAKAIAESLDGTIQAMGTITFSELAGKKSTARAGYMWNISDAFTTTSDFKEGAGVSKGAGENVYMTTDGLWDCFAGKDVLSVNDKNGVVTLNAEDIPLSVSGTRYDNATDMKDVVHFISADVQDVAVVASSGAATHGMIATSWSSSTSFAADDYCTYNDSLWKCKTANKAQTPTEGTYWTSVSVTGQIDALNQSLANKVNTSALGAAAYKGVATSVASGNTNLITSGAVYTQLLTKLDYPATKKYTIPFGIGVTYGLIGYTSGTDRVQFHIPTYPGYSKVSVTASGSVNLVNTVNTSALSSVAAKDVSDCSVDPSGLLRIKIIFNTTSLTGNRPYSINNGDLKLTITLTK